MAGNNAVEFSRDRGVAAANRTIQFSIPSQPLSSAINAFIRQTGWRINYTSALASGKTSGAATGLNVRVSAPGSAALVAPGVAAVDTVNVPADGSLLVLETITVQGTNPNSTMALPEAYAGGQTARGGQVGMLAIAT